MITPKKSLAKIFRLNWATQAHLSTAEKLHSQLRYSYGHESLHHIASLP